MRGKLPSRRQRLAIGLAGVTTELAAPLAAFAWGALPNGPARSVAFLVATSIWLTGAAQRQPVHALRRLLCAVDWLEMPNLHTRALAQWWLRETLLGLYDPVPEGMPPHRHFTAWCSRS